MTFTRGPLNRQTLGLGIREQIRQAALDGRFYTDTDANDLTDIMLLRYVSATGKEEWFDFLVKVGDFFDKKGKIRKVYEDRFIECLMFTISRNHVPIARKLYMLGARLRSVPGSRLKLAIINNNYDMAELLFEMGARIRTISRFTACLKKADDKMIMLIVKYRANIVFMIVDDSEKRVIELLEKRKMMKGKTV